MFSQKFLNHTRTQRWSEEVSLVRLVVTAVPALPLKSKGGLTIKYDHFTPVLTFVHTTRSAL